MIRPPAFGGFGAVRITWAALPLGSIAYVRETVEGLHSQLFGPIPAEQTGEFITERQRIIGAALVEACGSARP